MIKKLSLLAVLGAGPILAASPQVPDSIKAPANEKVILQAHAIGAQIYICKAGTDGKPAWTLKAPEAQLQDQKGALIGSHFAGPTWKLNDGSEVVGKAAAQSNSPDANAIPWLLVRAIKTSGDGLLSQVTSIQRINTKGGKPPSPADCNNSKLNAEAKSAYSADYYFYAPTASVQNAQSPSIMGGM